MHFKHIKAREKITLAVTASVLYLVLLSLNCGSFFISAMRLLFNTLNIIDIKIIPIELKRGNRTQKSYWLIIYRFIEKLSIFCSSVCNMIDINYIINKFIYCHVMSYDYHAVT